jgi:hypothetical protein
MLSDNMFCYFFFLKTLHAWRLGIMLSDNMLCILADSYINSVFDDNFFLIGKYIIQYSDKKKKKIQ